MFFNVILKSFGKYFFSYVFMVRVFFYFFIKNLKIFLKVRKNVFLDFLKIIIFYLLI